MECSLAVVSDFAYTDRGNGKQYILGVIRYIWANAVPAVHQRLAVTFALEEYSSHATQPVLARLHVQNADGVDVMPPSPELALPFQPIGPAQVGKSLCQLTVELNQLQLPTFGDYAVLLIRSPGEVLARAKFTVQPLPVAPTAP